MFTFKSIGHAIATGLNDAFKGAKAIETFIAKYATTANQQEVEALTSLIPSVGPTAAAVERGVFAVAGEVASILTDLTNGGEAKLLNAGFDSALIAEFTTLIHSVPGLIADKGMPAPMSMPAATLAFAHTVVQAPVVIIPAPAPSIGIGQK